MTTTFNEVSRIIVFIGIDDPMTHDTEFQNQIKYGNFVRKSSAFDEKNRRLLREQASGDSVMDLKFFLEIYTDKLSDFVQTCLVSDKYQRGLYFQRMEFIQPPPDVTEDLDPEELEDYTEIVHYYELKTLRKFKMSLPDADTEDTEEETAEPDTQASASGVKIVRSASRSAVVEDDEDIDTDDLDEEDAELSREMDANSSLFLPASKAVH